LDAELVRRGLAPSRAAAQELVEEGAVLVAGAVAARPGRLVGPAEPLVVTGDGPRFVSRGGDKLDAALDRFRPYVAGITALDAGASTGGFTDCLLQRGAARVVAVDVGRGQLHERLRADPRVVSLERTDIRTVNAEGLDEAPFPLVVGDLSFISLATVAPALLGLAAPGADMVLLVKPQFEVGRREASRGRGVIKEPSLWAAAIRRVAGAMEAGGATMMGAMVSPRRGAAGNVEFLVHFRAHQPPPAGGGHAQAVDIDAVAAAGEGTRAW
jgi:23S rRNA (cytidine1920-2'-O)/16S rRNA (cytidine1409-2'-O)-methyltransferase